MVLVTEPRLRWDELLDAHLPILVSCDVAPWEDLGEALWEAGCPTSLPLRLVQANGQVLKVEWHGRRLLPAPAGTGWTLALGWTHPDEGWRARLPLWGQRFVVTRAAGQSDQLVHQLQELGAQAFAVPTIAFTDPDDFGPWVQAVARISEFTWTLFTSPNGVDFFVKRLCQSGLDLRSLGQCKLACIGPATAKALSRHGLKCDLLPTEYVAEGLLEALQAELGPELRGQRILLPRAQVARTVLPDALTRAGADVLVAPVYKTVAPDLSSLPDGEASLLFTSSSTVTNWVQTTGRLDWPCYCIGPITAQTASEQGLRVLGVADPYTIEGLVQLLLR
jgi:uroporphyrinogen III methyltransferase/synthase